MTVVTFSVSSIPHGYSCMYVSILGGRLFYSLVAKSMIAVRIFKRARIDEAVSA
jgi:hypothetical protein